MKLTEILNKKVDYEVERASGTLFHTRAEIGGRIINFAAVEEAFGEWELSFGEMTATRATYAKTGSGNELEVFAMVKDSILEFISRNAPDVMYFTADKEGKKEKNNRAELYDRLIKRFKIPGYKYSREKGDLHDRFLFVKNGHDYTAAY